MLVPAAVPEKTMPFRFASVVSVTDEPLTVPWTKLPVMLCPTDDEQRLAGAPAVTSTV